MLERIGREGPGLAGQPNGQGRKPVRRVQRAGSTKHGKEGDLLEQSQGDIGRKDSAVLRTDILLRDEQRSAQRPASPKASASLLHTDSCGSPTGLYALKGESSAIALHVGDFPEEVHFPDKGKGISIPLVETTSPKTAATAMLEDVEMLSSLPGSCSKIIEVPKTPLQRRAEMMAVQLESQPKADRTQSQGSEGINRCGS